MSNVLVFVTSVDSALAARTLRHPLDLVVGPSGWNFDLDDCDRILRVSQPINPEVVIRLLHENGFLCRELGDEVHAEAESRTQQMVS